MTKRKLVEKSQRSYKPTANSQAAQKNNLKIFFPVENGIGCHTTSYRKKPS